MTGQRNAQLNGTCGLWFLGDVEKTSVVGLCSGELQRDLLLRALRISLGCWEEAVGPC